MLGVETAYTQPQQPTIQPRERAGLAGQGSVGRRGWEPAITVGSDIAITVFHTVAFGVRYGIYDRSQAEWLLDANIPSAGLGAGPHDPSVAYNRRTGEFVAAARTGESLLTSQFVRDPNAPNGFGEFEPRVCRAEIPAEPNQPGGAAYDKPWIVAGEMSFNAQEYYVTYWAPSGYLRSIDGGRCWSKGSMIDGDTNEPIPARFPQPAVYQERPLYVAYLTGGDPAQIRFLVGEDIDPVDPNDALCDPNDPNDLLDPNVVGVVFRHLYRPPMPEGDGDPPHQFPLSIGLNNTSFASRLPGNLTPPMEAKTVPQLAVDPTDPWRLYVVYHDTATDDPSDKDVNVYMNVLTMVAPWWQAGPRIQINDDQTTFESDQFIPSVTVDYAGRIHVTFYDDRNYTDDPNDPENDQQPDGCELPKFDVFYAYSDTQGAQWANVELHAVPSEPALDFDWKKIDPHEYNGIACDGNTVWATYAGTWKDDPQNNKAVISANRMDWPPP